MRPTSKSEVVRLGGDDALTRLSEEIPILCDHHGRVSAVNFFTDHAVPVKSTNTWPGDELLLSHSTCPLRLVLAQQPACSKKRSHPPHAFSHGDPIHSSLL